MFSVAHSFCSLFSVCVDASPCAHVHWNPQGPCVRGSWARGPQNTEEEGGLCHLIKQFVDVCCSNPNPVSLPPPKEFLGQKGSGNPHINNSILRNPRGSKLI